MSECKACGKLNGWWCRGCGGGSKIQGMIAAGIDKSKTDSIYEQQSDGCDEPFVPCYVCNKDGKKPCPTGYDHISEFWN